MSSPETPAPADEAVLERYKSYGIGGRGNLRRPSELQIVETTVDGNGTTRRRSSVINKMTGMFRKKSTTETVEEVE